MSQVVKPADTQATRQLLEKFSAYFLKRFGTIWPELYMAYDTETTGFYFKNDVIIQWAHRLVYRGEVIDEQSCYVNWYDSVIPAEEVDQRLFKVSDAMRRDGKTWNIDADKLRSGVKPAVFVAWLYDLFLKVQALKALFVSHNGISFDNRMIEAHFAMDLTADKLSYAEMPKFSFTQSNVFDTGMFEKAATYADRLQMYPKPGEYLRQFFTRVGEARLKGGYYNMKLCLTKYGLLEKIDSSDLHSAATDVKALHLLMEHYRAVLTEAFPTMKSQGAKRDLTAPAFRMPQLQDYVNAHAT